MHAERKISFFSCFVWIYNHTVMIVIKNIENFVWFPKQYLLGFFLLEKQFANIPDRGFLFLRKLFYSTL